MEAFLCELMHFARQNLKVKFEEAYYDPTTTQSQILMKVQLDENAQLPRLGKL